jgi:Zn-dependent protease with chaperone function
MYLCGDKDAACRGLAALACGSKVLSPKTNLRAFKDQELALPWLFAFLHDLYSSHPRLTKRVAALEEAASLVGRQ